MAEHTHLVKNSESDGIVRSEEQTHMRRSIRSNVVSFGGKKYSSEVHKQFMMKVNNNTGETTDIMKRTLRSLFTQTNAEKRIRLFGERAVAAIYKEYKQLNEGAVPEKPVFGPIDSDTLTSEHLETINLSLLLLSLQHGGVYYR